MNSIHIVPTNKKEFKVIKRKKNSGKVDLIHYKTVC